MASTVRQGAVPGTSAILPGLRFRSVLRRDCCCSGVMRLAGKVRLDERAAELCGLVTVDADQRDASADEDPGRLAPIPEETPVRTMGNCCWDMGTLVSA
jgi:hypothetical protein